jgi:hypothetical protein
MEIHFKIIGVILIVLAFIHVIFPKYFNWKIELVSLSLINRQMMTVHTLFIAIAVLLMGILCVTSANELLGTNLGKRVCLGLSIFWSIRFLVQFFGYSSELWKGKRFETTVHILFALLWAYISAIFFIAYFR